MLPSESEHQPLIKPQKSSNLSTIKHFFTVPNDRERYRDININDLNAKIKDLFKAEIDEITVDELEKAMMSLEESYWYPKAQMNSISTLAGWPKNIQAMLKHSKSLQTFERHALYEMIKQCKSFEAFLEILTKSLIYREMPEGTIIPVPRSDNPEKLEFYQVKKNIVTGKGFTATLLVPVHPSSKSPPILTVSGSNFHPTGLDSISAVIEDMKWNLGEGAYNSAKDALKEIMKEINNDDLIVTGHSLGGTLAQYVTSEYADKIRRLVTYNSPGVNQEVHRRFDAKVKNLKHPLDIDIYQTKWDIVQEAESPHLGYNLDRDHKKVKLSLTRFQLDNALTTIPHTYLCLSNPSKIGIEVDTFGQSPLKGKDLTGRIQNKYDAYQMYSYLNDPFRDLAEFFRKAIGGLMIAPALELLRPIFRAIVPSRSEAVSENNVNSSRVFRP